tara:strand:+ start:654 stop:1199 length:546 start_codon:yes stop_codon:yes gene_type:complete
VLQILVIGAGLIGLSCAKELFESGHNVTVIDSRAEIGHTQTLPGLHTGEVDLTQFASQIQLTNTGCRRPWLEKSMAQRLPVEFLLRTEKSTINREFDLIINSKIDHSTQMWSGGVTLLGRQPHTEIIAERADGTVECWTKGTLPEVEGGWLERFEGTFNEESASVDASILRGIELASEQKA